MKHIEITKLDDYFAELGQREEKGVYSYRISGYSKEVRRFIQNYYEAARVCWVIIDKTFRNPDSDNLSYYNEIMGDSFEMSQEFFNTSLRKWLPRAEELQRGALAESLYNTLLELRRAGKTIV